MKYKLATSGYMVVEIEANSPKEAEEKLFSEDRNELYSQEVHEVVKADEDFKQHTDLN